MSKLLRRCAVYTRKSSEEGLEQEFNSLDAQREAGVAFVKSQTGEGWRLVETRYDDGGISGGTLERPALQRLLKDIDAGRVQVVVVYTVKGLQRIVPFDDKIMRMSSQSATIESGRVFLPKRAPWLEELRSELLQFPNGRYDDQVDSMSQFLNWAEAKRRSNAYEPSFAGPIIIRGRGSGPYY